MSKPTVFNEVLTIRVPPALTAALSKVAASELTTSSEVARRVLIEKLTRCGALKLPCDDGPDDFTPDHGVRQAA